MKFTYITCNISMLEQMEELLKELEIQVYQVIPKALAESNFDIPHKDTAVWPGFNASLLVQEEVLAKSEALMKRIEDGTHSYFIISCVSLYYGTSKIALLPKCCQSANQNPFS
ncbi:PG0541 family transporter-associated protein [Porphyromonas somerae]|uniref:PG0541 family transporter-associated protein n=1 Tax=Porphyromonas somerae TaxID=322095 RepID=UPI001FD02B34|nr:PG0541 family transporter-associated protein [Porphyromonas somerae]